MKKQLLQFALILFTAVIQAQTWSQIDAPTIATINACSFINENKGWIITDNAIFSTTDGGVTWTNQFYPLTPDNNQRNFKSIHFINENVGIIACNNILSAGSDPQLVSSILWTNNGGTDWEYKNLGAADYNDNDAKLVSPTTAYTIGKAGRFKKTVDGGETWINYDYNANSISAGLKLAAIDESAVFFGGIQNGFIHYGTFGHTFDGGSNWLVSNIAPGPVNAIYFLNDTEGWLGGNSGLLKHTADDGATWDIPVTGVDAAITDIAFTDNLTGWATTDFGQIINTTDQGISWNMDFLGNFAINAIVMTVPNDVGYAVGADGLILKHNGNLAVAENTKSAGFSLYPNPANNIVNIQFENSPSNKTLVIYNLVGQIVMKTDSIAESSLAFNVQGLVNGIYYLHLSDGNKTYKSAKLVVNHK